MARTSKLRAFLNLRVGPICGLKFLGFTLYGTSRNGEWKVGITIHPKSLKRFKDKVKSILRERSQWTIELTLNYLKSYLRGWLAYYGLADMKYKLEDIAGWARRKLRARLWSQWKIARNRFRKLKLITTDRPNLSLTVGACLRHARAHGSWHMSIFRPLNAILSNKYLESIGFPNILEMYQNSHDLLVNRRVREVRTVV